jgi:hypothetical protein
MSVTKTLSAAVIVLASATGAYASSITVSIFDAASYNTGFGAAPNVGEDFETLGGSMGAGEVSDGFSTAVGSFSTLGGTGGGGTVTGLPGNTGNLLALRNGNVYGRENTVPTGGSWFLDSNDTWGMSWDVAIGKKFDAVSFILNDASDVGAFLRITTGTTSHELRTGGKLPDGNAKLVVIDFGEWVSSANIMLGNYTVSGGSTFKLNDGFSVDGLQVAAVPLPASVLMLGAALGGLGFAGRRKAKKKAAAV